jgi:glutaredoxin
MAGLSTVPQIFNEKGEHIGGYSELVASLGLDPNYH